MDEMLKKGHIRKSELPIGAPVIFVKKKDGKLRFCIDLRKVNAATIKNTAPMPLPNELMDEVRDSKVFTKLDLKNGYHLFRIKKGDEWKTAFNTHRGHYEMTVVPFGLTNAPAFFQTRMNEILWDLRERGVVVYIDDFLIHSKDTKEHKALVKEVLMRLRKNFLYCNAKKCVFKQDEIEFLGMILSKDSVSLRKEKSMQLCLGNDLGQSKKSSHSWVSAISIADSFPNTQKLLGL
jgi:hypothetical protein